MIRLAALAGFQALAVLAGPALLAPAVLLGAAALAETRSGFRRIRFGALFFASMFLAAVLFAWLERALIGGPAVYFEQIGLLMLRGFASFCGALAAVRLFTLAEALVFLKKLRAPDHVVALAYLMAQDVAVLSRLAGEASCSLRARTASLPRHRRPLWLARAAGGFLVLTADKFRFRHEHMEARGLGLNLPVEAWRTSERRHQG